MLKTKQQKFDVFPFPPLRPKCSSIFSIINHGKIKSKHIFYMNADILIRHHNMRLGLNKEKQPVADIRNKDIHMLVSPIFLEDNKAHAKIKLVISMQPRNTW